MSNRGPFGFTNTEDDNVQIHRSGGGLVTALLGLTQKIPITWFASALSQLEKEWPGGEIQLDGTTRPLDLELIPFTEEEYEGYYNVISNPLLWFLQHSMWDFKSNPTITRDVWDTWEHGYVAVNRRFAEAVAERIRTTPLRTLVMMQDYHLYLAPRMLRTMLGRRRRQHRPTITHFIHIPWPGPEEIRMLPPGMRRAILDGLTAADMVGCQTRDDAMNFMRSVESHLPGAYVNYRRGRIWYRNRATEVRDFPISIDVSELKQLAESEGTAEARAKIEDEMQGMQVILRVDRTEPSKNIVRGFQAFGEMLEMFPD
ncbi:MAG: trehalose-6-phosphate synthase, partial [Anaerolineaceae bacterium]